MRLWRNQRGDTLVEVVLAIAIIGAVLATSMSVATSSYQVGMQARERTQAANMAQGEVEKLLLYRDDQLSANLNNASTTFFDTIWANCATACSMTETAGKWVPTPCAGGNCPADSRYQGIMTTSITMTAETGANKANGTVQVTWRGVRGIDNTVEIPLTLADTRVTADLLRDCGQVGAATCD